MWLPGSTEDGAVQWVWPRAIGLGQWLLPLSSECFLPSWYAPDHLTPAFNYTLMAKNLDQMSKALTHC